MTAETKNASVSVSYTKNNLIATKPSGVDEAETGEILRMIELTKIWICVHVEHLANEPLMEAGDPVELASAHHDDGNPLVREIGPELSVARTCARLRD